MKAKCKKCGDWFTLPKEEELLINDGWCNASPEMCEECFLIQEDNQNETDNFSDADSGL